MFKSISESSYILMSMFSPNKTWSFCYFVVVCVWVWTISGSTYQALWTMVCPLCNKKTKPFALYIITITLQKQLVEDTNDSRCRWFVKTYIIKFPKKKYWDVNFIIVHFIQIVDIQMPYTIKGPPSSWP